VAEEHSKRHRDDQLAGPTGTLLLSALHDCFENGSKSRSKQPNRNDDASLRVWASL
jgi:hypothetical protein